MTILGDKDIVHELREEAAAEFIKLMKDVGVVTLDEVAAGKLFRLGYGMGYRKALEDCEKTMRNILRDARY